MAKKKKKAMTALEAEKAIVSKAFIFETLS